MRRIIILISGLLIAGSCVKEESADWWCKIQFVDSTYTHEKSEYFVGEALYILFTGEHPYQPVPESLPVEVYVRDGDCEIIYLSEARMDALKNPRAGKINTERSITYEINNGILEIVNESDTIYAFSTSKTFPCMDTACIKSNGGR
ncbi:hypothetical protein DRQ20_07010 [bacterium]|nr:MAG: hypothetical protein DRQ20_07010 [bacterium]